MENFMTYNFNITKANCILLKGCNKNSYNRTRVDYGLVFYPEGGYTFKFHSGLTLRMCKNSLLFNPKDSVYDIEVNENKDCYGFSFDLDVPFACDPFVMSVRHAQFFLDTFKEAERMYRFANLGYIMNGKSKLYSIIGAMQQEYGLGYISGDNYSVILPAIERIHQSYTSGTPSVSELAALCSVSPEYFRMLFKKKYGTSPIKYINSLRLNHSKELLSSGMYSVSEVSSLSGFSALPYFCREFKKKYGVSPSAFSDDT